MSGLLPLAGGTTVTIVTRTVAGQDASGVDVYATSTRDVPGCVVYPRNSSELVQGQDTVIVGLTALLPAGTVIAATDRVQVAGDLYEVDGQPGLWRNAFLGVDECVQVALTRVTG